jgi:hypothetical protein
MYLYFLVLFSFSQRAPAPSLINPGGHSSLHLTVLGFVPFRKWRPRQCSTELGLAEWQQVTASTVLFVEDAEQSVRYTPRIKYPQEWINRWNMPAGQEGSPKEGEAASVSRCWCDTNIPGIRLARLF